MAALKLSPRQQAVVLALCDTFVPSLPPPAAADFGPDVPADDIAHLYEASAVSNGVPEDLVATIGRLPADKQQGLLLFMWLLGSRLGTFLLAGLAALSWRFPFVLSFPELPRSSREQIMLSWRDSWLSVKRLIFQAFYRLVASLHYNRVPSDGNTNPTWPALKYPGKDPNRLQHLKANELKAEQCVFSGSLENIKAGGRMLPDKLASIGLKLLPPVEVAKMCFLAGTQLQESMDTCAVECDIAIVGSGAGGGVAAAVLAAAGYRVVVLEKGDYVRPEELAGTEREGPIQLYEGQGLFGTADGAVQLLAGNTLGGGTTINWCASFRTPKHVRMEWAEKHGLKQFAGADYDMALDAVCKRIGVHDTETKHNGQNTILVEGCQKLGWHEGIIPRNARGAHECGWCQWGCVLGNKQGSMAAWLPDAVQHGAKILVGCHVQRVLYTSGMPKSVHGVAAVVGSGADKRRLLVKAKAVVVSAGSLHSPALLLRSGLQNKNIGQHLHLHPATFVSGFFPNRPINPYHGCIMSAYSKQYANWETTGYGPLIETPSVHPGGFAAFVPWDSAAQHKFFVSRFSHTSSLLVLLRDKGEGKVILDKTGGPEVHYVLSPEDDMNMREGIVAGLRVLAAAGAAEVFTLHNGKDQCRLSDKSAFDKYLQQVRGWHTDRHGVLLGSAHQMGTCRMGTDPEVSVIKPTGETWEVDELFVADASTLPTPSGVNPMVTTEAVSYMIAQFICQQLKSQE